MELKDIEKKLNDRYAKGNVDKTKKGIEGIDSEEGGWNSSYLWKIKQKISPHSSDPPTAMMDSERNILTDPEEIKNEAKKHFKKVLENKPMNNPDLIEFKEEREKLCKH